MERECTHPKHEQWWKEPRRLPLDARHYYRKKDCAGGFGHWCKRCMSKHCADAQRKQKAIVCDAAPLAAAMSGWRTR